MKFSPPHTSFFLSSLDLTVCSLCCSTVDHLATYMFLNQSKVVHSYVFSVYDASDCFINLNTLQSLFRCPFNTHSFSRLYSHTHIHIHTHTHTPIPPTGETHSDLDKNPHSIRARCPAPTHGLPLQHSLTHLSREPLGNHTGHPFFNAGIRGIFRRYQKIKTYNLSPNCIKYHPFQHSNSIFLYILESSSYFLPPHFLHFLYGL